MHERTSENNCFFKIELSTYIYILFECFLINGTRQPELPKTYERFWMLSANSMAVISVYVSS